jgi:23S rRNA U2552 (ribose-2'-O)-methylase RlmE/FtsJ
MEYENKITKKSDLDNNDSLSSFNHWAAQQNHNAFEVFHNFIKNTSPKRILEIGTALGGFTSFLKYTVDTLELNCDVLSYDIYDKSWYKDIKDMGVDIRIENIFLDNYTKLPQYVIDFIQSDGTTLILCDGGDKIREFNILSDYMKPGDHILAHDYAFDREYFDKNIYLKVWNWHELSESDIINACDRNNLKDYQRDLFQSVAWVSKIKE